MREIKFRAWDKLRKKYIYSDKFLTLGRFFTKIDLRNILLMYVEEFTGLKDKNGKEIFEGDILSNGTFNAEVVFLKEGFKIKIIWNNEVALISDYKDCLEVIGNIYENPELLEGGKN